MVSQKCANCWWWQSRDNNGETCKDDHGTAESHWCKDWSSLHLTPTCGECRWLHEPLRGKTCFRHYGRTAEDYACDPPLSASRRYTVDPQLTRVLETDMALRDPVSGSPIAAIAAPSTSVLLLPEPDSRKGILVRFGGDHTAHVTPVIIWGENGILLRYEDRRVPVAEFAAIATVHRDSGEEVIGGRITHLTFSLQSPRHHKRVAAGDGGDSSDREIDHAVASLVGQAAAVARIMISNGLSPEAAADKVAIRVAAGAGLQEEQQADLRRLLLLRLKL